MVRVCSWIGPLFLIFLVATGCTIPIVIGRHLDAEVLEKSLKNGESTRAQVNAILGQPYATGRWMTPTDNKPTTVWTYYYEKGTLDDARRMVLFVYFDEDKYVGYMWFSSLLN